MPTKSSLSAAPETTAFYSPTSPALTSGLGVHFPELRSHVLAVVAVDQDGVLAKFSNPCGSAKDFCLAAPGVNLIAADIVNDARYPGRPHVPADSAAPPRLRR